MAVFSDLPNELIIGIWGYVIEPDDVESFALASKRIFGLSSQFVIEHASLKQRYSKIFIPWYEDGNYGAADLLEKILLNNRIVFYISIFWLSDWRLQWKEQTTPQAYSKDTMALFEGAIRTSPFITGSEAEDWITAIEKGNEDPIVALIIMRLTKIKEFRLRESNIDAGGYLLRTLERITQSSEATVQPSQSKPRIEINGHNQMTSTSPSMFFTVSEMELGCVHINFDTVSQILRCTKGLKDFECWGGSGFEMSSLCDKLLQCSPLSLQKLTIHCENIGQGDIHQFQKLAEVTITFTALLGDTDDTCKNLADVLPLSIESVIISTESRQTIPCQIFRRLILDMIKCKKERLPKLQALAFDFGFYDQEDITRNMELTWELQGLSAEVGVLLSANGKKLQPGIIA